MEQIPRAAGLSLQQASDGAVKGKTLFAQGWAQCSAGCRDPALHRGLNCHEAAVILGVLYLILSAPAGIVVTKTEPSCLRPKSLNCCCYSMRHHVYRPADVTLLALSRACCLPLATSRLASAKPPVEERLSCAQASRFPASCRARSRRGRRPARGRRRRCST